MFRELKKPVGKNMNYKIGDFLIQIKNMSLAKGKSVTCQKTKLIKEVALSLKRMGYLLEVEDKEEKITATLSYRKKEPVLMNLKLISKPGLRIYMEIDTLKETKKPSTLIISTSKGILSKEEAIKKGVGGEVLAEIW